MRHLVWNVKAESSVQSRGGQSQVGQEMAHELAMHSSNTDWRE